MATEWVIFTSANYIFANIGFYLRRNFYWAEVLTNLPNYLFIDVLCTLMKQEASCKI